MQALLDSKPGNRLPADSRSSPTLLPLRLCQRTAVQNIVFYRTESDGSPVEEFLDPRSSK